MCYSSTVAYALCVNIPFDVQSYIIHVRAIIILFDVVKRLYQKASNSTSIIVLLRSFTLLMLSAFLIHSYARVHTMQRDKVLGRASL